jgi:hypothetical protein
MGNSDCTLNCNILLPLINSLRSNVILLFVNESDIGELWSDNRNIQLEIRQPS